MSFHSKPPTPVAGYKTYFLTLNPIFVKAILAMYLYLSFGLNLYF